METVAYGPVVLEFDDRVLRPRPWTLAQAEWAAELAPSAPRGAILEVCCGAGHIGLAAAVLTRRDLVQVDIDDVACSYARSNAERAGVADRVEVRQGSMNAVLHAGERFPLLLADPPYLPTNGIDRYPDDPTRAIDGGRTGLDLVRQCLDVGLGHLVVGGSMLLQVGGAAQAAVVAGLVGLLTDGAGPALSFCSSRTYGPTRAVVHLALSA